MDQNEAKLKQNARIHIFYIDTLFQYVVVCLKLVYRHNLYYLCSYSTVQVSKKYLTVTRSRVCIVYASIENGYNRSTGSIEPFGSSIKTFPSRWKSYFMIENVRTRI